MVVAATACALVAMVARIRKDESIAERADALRAECLRGRERDERAFSGVIAAKGNRTATQQALERAAHEPLLGASRCRDALLLANDALSVANVNVISDVACAAEFAYAALRCCAYNVRINHRFLDDRRTVETQAAQLQSYEAEAEILAGDIRDRAARMLQH